MSFLSVVVIAAQRPAQGLCGKGGRGGGGTSTYWRGPHWGHRLEGESKAKCLVPLAVFKMGHLLILFLL